MGALDLQVLQWFHDHRTPAMTFAMQLWSDLNGNWAMIAWAALFAGYVLWQCRYDWAFTVAAAVPAIELLGALVEGLAWIALCLAIRRRIAPRIDKLRAKA